MNAKLVPNTIISAGDEFERMSVLYFVEHMLFQSLNIGRWSAFIFPAFSAFEPL